MTGSTVWFGLLGPVEVRVDGTSVAMPRQLRVLLATLLCRPNQTVSIDELTGALWSDMPQAAPATLRSHVLRLRRLLGNAADRVVTSMSGYRIEVDARTELDTMILTGHCEAAREAAQVGDWPTVWRRASTALALWRGVPLTDVPSDRLRRDEAPGWMQARIEATEWAARAGLELGRATESVRLLQRLAAEEPHQESVHALLIEALAAAGQRAEALAVYRRLRATLSGDLGIEPGPRIAAAHQRVLSAGPARPDVPVGPNLHGVTASGPTGTAAPGCAPADGEPGSAGFRPRTGPVEPVSVLRQLPADPGTFTGRAGELRTILDAAAERTRSAPTVVLTTIEGMAGVGKTHLAVHAAHELVRAGRFNQLQMYVNLRGFDPDQAAADPSDVLDELLRALGVDGSRLPQGLDSRAALFRDRLHGREALLLLDNAVDVHQVRPLIPADPGCLVLITSRRSLAGLDGATSLTLGTLTPVEAMELLAAIAGAERVTADPAAAARIAHLCGQLPLAIALAAARLRARPTWSLTDLAEHLENGGIRAVTAGDRSLRAVFDLSYQGLPEVAQQVFRMLAVHPGRDCTAHSAAALTSLDTAAAREALELLVDENLLIQDTPGRYRLHNLLHAFARELADEDGTDARIRAIGRLTVWYCHTARAADDMLKTRSIAVRSRYASHLPAPDPPAMGFSDYDQALAWLDAERSNLMAVLTRAAENDLGHLVTNLALSLSWYLRTRGLWSGMLSVLRAAEESLDLDGDPALGGRVLKELGVCYCLTGRHEEALPFYEKALALHRISGDREGEGATLLSLGGPYDHLNRPQEAIAYRLRARTLFAELGNHLGEEAACLVNLAWSYRLMGRLDEAVAYGHRALAAFRVLHSDYGQAEALTVLGKLHQLLERDSEAVGFQRQALALYRGFGNRYAESDILNDLGVSYSRLGRWDQAQRAWHAAHASLVDMTHPRAAEAVNHLNAAARRARDETLADPGL